MPMPKSVTKYSNKNGVTFISGVDRANYTIQELSRAALKDVAKVIRKKMAAKMRKLPGFSKSRRPYKTIQTWVRGIETDLQIGFGNTKKGVSGDSWYAIQQELGTNGQPKRSILRDTVFESINDIQKIEAQYLSAIEDEAKAQALIDEAEEVGDEDVDT